MDTYTVNLQRSVDEWQDTQVRDSLLALEDEGDADGNNAVTFDDTIDDVDAGGTAVWTYEADTAVITCTIS